MSLQREVRLWVAQRATAAILAVCVIVHLITIVQAVQGGLSAAEILERTRGNVPWAAFYAVFVIAAALHGAIGLRNVLTEWLRLRADIAEVAVTVFAFVLTLIGLRAVAAVFGS